MGPADLIRTALTMASPPDYPPPEWRRCRELGGGMIVEASVHAFDLWRYLLDSEIAEVSAASRPGAMDDETVVISARMASGALASAVVSSATSDSNETDIYGRRGRLHVSLYQFDGFEFLPALNYPGDVRSRLRRGVGTLLRLPGALRIQRRGGMIHAMFRAEWHDYLTAIRHDRPPASTLEDGYRALQAATAAIESTMTGRAVPITAD